MAVGDGVASCRALGGESSVAAAAAVAFSLGLVCGAACGVERQPGQLCRMVWMYSSQSMQKIHRQDGHRRRRESAAGRETQQLRQERRLGTGKKETGASEG